ncbi:MAG: hypothetical protein NTW86_21105 [Candidatus Sumerlaeota bacterium]|nr:hypothetical protein [Candidatus Sumerlaeota bacterium]
MAAALLVRVFAGVDAWAAPRLFAGRRRFLFAVLCALLASRFFEPIAPAGVREAFARHRESLGATEAFVQRVRGG